MVTNRLVAIYSLLLIFSSLFQGLLGNNVDLRVHRERETLESCRIDKIYQLGDSIADTGNLILEFSNGASSKCGGLPYGQDFHHHHPTGRCSNGLLMIDYIASAAGLPFLNPYKNSNASFTHGVNFAVSGATALSSPVLDAMNIPSPMTNSSLDVQLHWMSMYFNTLCPDNQGAVCAEKLRHALFFIGEIGGNDYGYAITAGKSIEEVKFIVLEVVQGIINAARSVIHLGGVRLVIPGTFPSGYFPSHLTAYETDDALSYDENHCWKERNNLSEYHNDLLKQAIKELKREFPSVAIVYGDYYNAFMWLFQNAGKLGFDEQSTQKSCFGVGGHYNYDPSKRCGVPEATVCADLDVRISWDGIHLTQAAYKNMAEWLLTTIIPQIHCSAFISMGRSSS